MNQKNNTPPPPPPNPNLQERKIIWHSTVTIYWGNNFFYTDNSSPKHLDLSIYEGKQWGFFAKWDLKPNIVQCAMAGIFLLMAFTKLCS